MNSVGLFSKNRFMQKALFYFIMTQGVKKIEAYGAEAGSEIYGGVVVRNIF